MPFNPLDHLVEHPTFNEGDQVIVDYGEAQYRGSIRGFSNKGVVDWWIVEVDSEDLEKLPDDYPYTCIIAPHPAIRLLDTNSE